MKTAIAIAAHPDDIELMMAGTLLLLYKKGYEIHYLNISSGNLGSSIYDSETIKSIRLKEAQHAAKLLGAFFHAPFCDDLEIFYNDKNLRHLNAIIREVKPEIILTHSPVDYMEDHTTTCRLTVTATFARGMRNYKSIPERAAEEFDCTIYHAMPHTLRDPMRKLIIPGSFVNTAQVQEKKLKALMAHHSQQEWLDKSQKLNSYLLEMENMALKIGEMSNKYKYAEGWRRHLHAGFGSFEDDPLSVLGSDYLINQEYEQDLS